MRKAVVLATTLTCLFAASGSAEVTQRGGVRIDFDGSISPNRLPRHGSAPIEVSVSARISSTEAGKPPPQLRSIELAINRYGIIDPSGLPPCTLADIQPATTAKALEACPDSLVGHGHFSAKVLLPQQTPFPSSGKVDAFSATYHGRPAILAHVYGTHPAPTSITLPFTIAHRGGRFETVLSTTLPQVTSNWGYVTGISLVLRRRFRSGGSVRSYASGSCPAPRGAGVAVFPFAKASFGFRGRTLHLPPVIRSCHPR
jgi:hypothetical protein